MDLRRRLLARLGVLLGGLLAVALIVQLHSLRDDIDAETTASTHLVDVLLAAGDAAPGDAAALAGVRHLRIRTADQAASPAPLPAWADWLGLAPTPVAERQIRIGDRTLYIAPNPASEITERLGDTVRLLITLLLYSGATLLVAWLAADRALRPVRQLEAGLQRLARGADDPVLPRFALREFSRVAQAIDGLATALRDSRAAQQALARQLIGVQEDERRGLARELHDELGQSLTAMSVTAAHLERNAGKLDAAAVGECAGDLRRDLRQCGEQLRGLLRSLRPHGLDAAGLRQVLGELIDAWRTRETGIEFAVNLPPQLPPIDDACALALYRVVQEALTNVVRHSGARHCRVDLAVAGDDLTLRVEDDGCGLPQAGPARRGGLLGMAERLAMVGGSLQLQDGSSGGLYLSAHIPVHAGEEQDAVGDKE